MFSRIALGVFFSLSSAVTFAEACDYPIDYKKPSFEEQLLNIRKLSSFAFLGIVVSGKLISNATEIKQRTYKIILTIRPIETFYGHVPKNPVREYIRELGLGAACDPLQPSVGHSYIFGYPKDLTGLVDQDMIRHSNAIEGLEFDEIGRTNNLAVARKILTQ